MEHGTHLHLRLLQRAEAAFDDHQTLISAGCILNADRIIIGLKDPFAVILLRLTDTSPVNADVVALCDS